MKYSYNNGHLAVEPLTASKNFINALDKIPSILEQYEEKNKKIEADIPVLKEVVGSSWKKEPELKGLKSELAALERRIQLTLTAKPDAVDGEITGREKVQEVKEQIDTVPVNNIAVQTSSFNSMDNIRSSRPQSLKEIIGSANGRLVITGMGQGKNEAPEPPKEEAIQQPVQQSRRFKL